MDKKIDVYKVLDELLFIQGQIIVLETLYSKFPNLDNPSAEALMIQDMVADKLRNARRKLVVALQTWIGELK